MYNRKKLQTKYSENRKTISMVSNLSSGGTRWNGGSYAESYTRGPPAHSLTQNPNTGLSFNKSFSKSNSNNFFNNAKANEKASSSMKNTISAAKIYNNPSSVPKAELVAVGAIAKVPLKAVEAPIDYQDPRGVARPSTSSAGSVNPTCGNNRPTVKPYTGIGSKMMHHKQHSSLNTQKVPS